MLIEVVHQNEPCKLVKLDKWKNIEKYFMRWLSYPVSLTVRFESLQEQMAWYYDLVDLVNSSQLAQKNILQASWQVSIYTFDNEKSFSYKYKVA